MPTIADTLLKRARPKPKATSSTSPIVDIPEAADLLAKYVSAKKEMEVAKGLADYYADKLRAMAEPVRVDASRAAGKCLSSVNVNGQATYIYQNRYTTLEAVDENGNPTQQIRSLCADDPKFGTHFRKIMTVEVDLDGLNEEQQAMLLQLPIKVEAHYKPTDAFHQDATLDPATAKLASTYGIVPTHRYFTIKTGE